jgi:hypothetical protein
MLFLVGGPSQLDTWDMKPTPRPRSAGRSSRSRRPSRHRDQRDLPEDGEARRQVLAGALGLSHGDGGPRHRPPDDADRPAVHRRRRAPAHRLFARLSEGRPRRAARARAPAAADRPHRRATCRTARPPATSASNTTRSSSTPTRTRRTSRCRTCCRPTTSPRSGPSAGRSCATRSMGPDRRSRTTPQARQLDDNFALAYKLMSSRRPARRSPREGAGECATATAARASARAA